MQKKQLDSF